jgi:hypothetical protein
MGGVRGVVIGPAQRGPCAACGHEDVALGPDGQPSILHTTGKRHQKAVGTFVAPPIVPDASQRATLYALAHDGPTTPEGTDRKRFAVLRRHGWAKCLPGGRQTAITDKGRAAIGLPTKGEKAT